MFDAQTLLTVADEVNESFHSLLRRAVVDDSPEARVSAFLCLSVAEGFGAVLALLRSPYGSHAPILVRSMHEALADLNNLIADPKYLDQIRFDNADQQLRTFDAFLADPDLSEDAEMRTAMSGWRETEQATFDELSAKGVKRQSISKKFLAAGMASEYATAYRVACSFTHGNLTTLIARHGRAGPIRFATAMPPETLHMVLGMALSDFARAMETIPNFTNIGKADVQQVMDGVNVKWEQTQ